MKATLFTAAAALAFAGTAHAGDMKMKSDTTMTTTQTTQVIEAERLDGPMITIVPNTQFEVLGAVERNGETLYAIPASDEVFYNHVPNDLYDVTTDVDEVDTYTYEYRGMTFTNRVVENGTPGVFDGTEILPGTSR